MPQPHDLDFPFSTLRTGDVLEVVPGLSWFRMRLPYRLNHVNLWILEDGDELAVVDTGMNLPDSREAWSRVLAERFGNRRIGRVIATHYHSDHIGLAAWLCETQRANLFATHIEWCMARLLGIDATRSYVEVQRAFYRRMGFSPEQLDRLDAAGNAYAQKVIPVPPEVRCLRSGDRLAVGGRVWRVITAPGHSPEMACLYDAKAGILIAGDHVLPSITPNVSIYPAEPEGDPLSDYLGSFAPFLALPADTLVLPSHGRPFRGLHTRIRQIEAHHAERLDRVWQACAEPRRVTDLLDVLFEPNLNDHERVIATGEALAHIHCLTGRGRLCESVDGDGLLRYVRS